jgi:hypothetical protein
MDMIFSLCHLQEKLKEQQQPSYISFVDLTKAFDMVNRSALFKILTYNVCPPTMLAFIRSFHDSMQSSVRFDGSTSESFYILQSVKQGF